MMADETNVVAAWTGLDVSKETFDGAVYPPVEPGVPPRGLRAIPSKTFKRTQSGVKSFDRWARRVLAKHSSGKAIPPIRCVMEATGRYSRELAAWLVEVDPRFRPAIEDPKTIKDFKSSLKMRDKTDPIDAAAIARYGAERMPEPPDDLPPHYLEMRELSRERDHLRDASTNARLRFKELPEGAAREVHEKIMKALKEGVDEIDQRIRDLVSSNRDIQHAINKLTTIPGVGFTTAVVVLAECGPLERFSRSRKLTSFSGLAPVVKESGTSVKGVTRISKRGPARVRQVLYMASIAACERQRKLEDFRFKLITGGKAPLAARCAVMRKLLTIMRAVVVNDTDFDHRFGEISHA